MTTDVVQCDFTTLIVFMENFERVNFAGYMYNQ